MSQNKAICPYCLKTKGQTGMGIPSFVCQKHMEEAALAVGMSTEQFKKFLAQLQQKIECPKCGRKCSKCSFCECGDYIPG